MRIRRRADYCNFVLLSSKHYMTGDFYVMKYLSILIFIVALTLSSFSQEKNIEVAKRTSNVSPKTTKLAGEKEEFESAIAHTLAPERIVAIQKFLIDYPNSKLETRAREMLSGSRAELADLKLRSSETADGIKLFKLAVDESPKEISDKFFSGLLVKFPANLYFRGQRVAANEVARMIEEKVSGNPTRLLALATFYLSAENASEAKRLAEKTLELDPQSAAAYHTLGFANRINFDLDAAADAFARSVEIDPESVASKTSLAEMKRALGKSGEAEKIYYGILENDPSNANAETGLILSLFESGQTRQAEVKMSESLANNSKNLALLVGAAYWYAANKNGGKAVQLAQEALALEPRYTWTYIALARGFMAQGDPLSAERTLLVARQFGNFPTLEYELATTRAAAGFYKEAAEGLRATFSIENGNVKTKLGGRIERESESFLDLLSPERRAGIFQFSPADSKENSKLLKNLLRFSRSLEAESAPESEIESSSDEFISGEDPMKFHRQLFVASRLVESKKALPKVLEITQNAVAGVERGLSISNPSAAVLAEELYESRKLAEAGGRSVIVPQIPRATLIRIVRGRIEELAGWALFQEEKPDEAKTRLKTAISILPQDSAWSRSTMWKIGAVLASEGKSEEALDAYIKGYFAEEQSTTKKIVIENLYAKIYGSLEGLEERLEKKSSKKNSISIFTNKPIKEQAKEKPKPEIVAQNERDPNGRPAENTIDLRNVPSRVPIAKPTPAVIVKTQNQPADTVIRKPVEPDLITKKTIIPDEKSNNIVTLDATTTQPGITSPTTVKILVANSNISELPNLEKELQKEDSIENKTAVLAETKIEKSLFDPVVIKVPRATKEPKIDEKKKPESIPSTKLAEDVKILAERPIEKPRTEAPSDVVAETQVADSENQEKEATEEDIVTGLQRPRIVAKEDVISSESLDKIKPCEIQASQDVISIINGGGSLGVMLWIEGTKSGPQNMKATSSSVEDIEVVFEPEIAKISGRSFFIIKSISSIQGLFGVTFEAPCGKREIPVKVR